MKERLIPLDKRFKTQTGEFHQATWLGTNESGWDPIGDKVIVYPDQAAEKTAGNVHIPGDVAARQTLSAVAGIVVALGPDCNINVKPGDRVFTEKFAGELVPGHDGKIYRIMDQNSIGAVFKPSTIQRISGLRS